MGVQGAGTGTEPSTNLPEQLSPFIGRATERVEVAALVARSRLVTLLGTGGAGKTRLALAVAADLLEAEQGQPVWMVELGSMARPDLVLGAVATTLGLREDPHRMLITTVTDTIGDRPVLLVLDNCEHLIGAVANVTDHLLRACPGLRVLATSRQPLSIDPEIIYRVPSLSIDSPGSPDDAATSDAVQFFLDRARQHQPTFTLDEATEPVVVDLCRRLDGIPLAIELAAVRLRTLPLDEVHRRLDNGLALLAGGHHTALPRQQTLRATIDWSYDLLSELETMVLCHLSVFAGGFTAEAAEAVFADYTYEQVNVAEVLHSLADKSLVHVDSDRPLRYRLHETIRQYAGEQLVERGALARHAARDAHARVFLELAEQAAPELVGKDQKLWLDRLDLERDNLRGAMGYFLSVSARHEQALRLGVALRRLWVAHGYMAEGSALLGAALELPGSHAPRALRGRALCAAGVLSARRSEHHDAQVFYAEALQIGRALADEEVMAEALAGLAWAALSLGHQEAARPLADDAVEMARRTGDMGLLGLVLERRASVNYDKVESCLADYDESLRHLRQVEDRYNVGIVENNLGDLELLRGNHQSARPHIETAIEISLELDDTSVVYCYLNLACANLLGGDVPAARRSNLDALRGGQRTGDQFVVANAVLGFALCASADGHDADAAEWHGVADALLERLGAVLEVGEVQRRAEDHGRLRARLGAAEFDARHEAGRTRAASDGVAAVAAIATAAAADA